MNKIDPPIKFQFSIARMLLTTAAVALVFGVFKFVFAFTESIAVFSAALVAAASGGLVLLGGKREFGVVLWYVAAIIVLGLVICLASVVTYKISL
jgi:hypothetical protein